MSSAHCPQCGRRFPLTIQMEVRLHMYCDTPMHWSRAKIDMQLCTRNITYLFAVFIPMTVKEHDEDKTCRRMLAWLEEYVGS